MQVRFDSDVTASDEWIKLDNITVTASEEVDGEVQAVETVLLSEDFDDIHDTDDSAAIAHDGGWDVRGDQLVTDGHNDGILKTAAVQADGDVDISAGDERVFFDNLTVTETSDDVVQVPSGDAITVGFEGLASGDVVDGQFEGVTVSAQRAGDDANS